MYLTYDEYKSMGGTLDVTTFTTYEYDAEVEVNNKTFNRLRNEETIPEEVKRCMYKLIELVCTKSKLFANEQEGRGYQLASQSNDGVSSTYVTFTASELLEKSQMEVEHTVKKYLYGVYTADGRALIYRGLYPNE